MINILKEHTGGLIYNGQNYNNVENVLNELKEDEPFDIVLLPGKKSNIYYFLFKDWMLVKSTKEFDFMRRFNNDIPIPLNKMRGYIIEETPAMYKVSLNEDQLYLWEGWVPKCGIIQITEI